MISMRKTEEKGKKSQKIGKMAQNRVYVPPETPLRDPDFEFSQGNNCEKTH